MERFQRILCKELIFVGAIVFISIVASIVLLFMIKRLSLEKWLYWLVSIFLMLAVFVGGQRLLMVSLDLHFKSVETFVGSFQCPARDTVILNDDNRTKLFAAISVPSTSKECILTYSKRSKILVDIGNK